MLIILPSESAGLLQRNTDAVLAHFRTWCSSNRLLINVSKTIYILFRREHLLSQPNFTFVIDNVTLENVSYTKFLGLHIDKNLSWSKHIEHVLKKLNSAYYVIRNLKPIVEEKYLLNIYYALVYSHIKYLILYWGQSKDIHRVFILQKRILRLIFSYQPLDSCRPLFKTRKILTVTSIFIYEAGMFVKKHLNMCPSCNYIHNHDTRSASNIYVDKYRLSLFKKSAYYACSTVYNKLPQQMKNISSPTKFRKEFLDFLYNKSFYTLSEFLDTRY